jgi:hypothetical protein
MPLGWITAGANSLATNPNRPTSPADAVRIVADVKKRQRRRKEHQRSQHAEATRTPDRPALVVSGAKLCGSRTPASFRVCISGLGRPMSARSRSTESATMGASFNRPGAREPGLASIGELCLRGLRSTSFEVTTLGGVEDRATRPLREVIAGEVLSFERKGALAQFIGVQLMRSPTFFRTHAASAEELVDELRPRDYKRAYLRSVEGDVERARAGVRETFERKPDALTAMASFSVKVANVLAHMRWNIL